MARVLTLAYAQMRHTNAEILRSGIVLGCALALIAAGHVLPF